MFAALEFLARLLGLKNGGDTEVPNTSNQDKEKVRFLEWFKTLSDADQAKALEMARKKAAKRGENAR